jgi:hypothetical protein
MRKPKAVLAEIYGAAAVLAVAEREVFLPERDGHGGITMYQNACGGCVNYALMVEAGMHPHTKFPGELSVMGRKYPEVDIGDTYPTDQVKAISELIALNDTGRLQTREQVAAALMEDDDGEQD